MSARKVLLAAAALVGFAGLVAAAEPVKLDLSKFKWKATFEGGESLGGYDEGEAKLFFYAHGTATGEVTVPEDGEYTITIDASCTEAQKEFAKFKLTVGDAVVAKEHALKAEEQKPQTFTAKLKKGKQNLAIEFLNDAFKEGEYDRNLYVHAVKLEKK